jgi:hypothetical protein
MIGKRKSSRHAWLLQFYAFRQDWHIEAHEDWKNGEEKKARQERKGKGEANGFIECADFKDKSVHHCFRLTSFPQTVLPV